MSILKDIQDLFELTNIFGYEHCLFDVKTLRTFRLYIQISQYTVSQVKVKSKCGTVDGRESQILSAQWQQFWSNRVCI